MLKLVTIPNLLLSWLRITHLATSTEPRIEDSDIEITADLIANFQSDLKSRRISVSAISGPWGEQFNQILLPSLAYDKIIILASETIYSPQSLSSFSRVLNVALKGASEGRALVAAKKVYFGVGGSMSEFVRQMELLGCGVRLLDESGQGVARVLVEVTCSH